MERLKTDAPTDEPARELIAACRAGDREAFEMLFDLTRDRVYGLSLQLLGDEAAAADATQEVFLKLIHRIRQFEGRSRFTTWLHRIVVNTSLDGRRRRRPLQQLDSVPEPVLESAHRPTGSGAPESPESAAMRRERARRVRLEVAALSPRLRQVVALRFGAGLAYGEIAETLGISIGTVGSRLSRALVRLGNAFAHEEAP